MVKQIEIRGLKELTGFLTGLDRNLRKEIGKEGFQFMKDVAKTARFKAPTDTLETKDSINVFEEKEGIWVLEVKSRAAIFQEEGFKPHFVFTKDGWFIDKNGNKVSRSTKFWSDGFHWVSKNTPFIAPSVEHHLGKLSQRLSNATDKALGIK